MRFVLLQIRGRAIALNNVTYFEEELTGVRFHFVDGTALFVSDETLSSVSERVTLLFNNSGPGLAF